LSQERRVPDITVERMVLHGRFPYLGYPRRYRKEDYAAARAAMERMALTELAEQPLQKLSGGQRQKVYLAMALAQDTPVVLLDEPVTYLDIGHQLQLMELVKELRREGKTVLMVLHDLPHAMAVADRVILMEQGRIVQQGTAEEICRGGEIERIFGAALRRVKTDDGWQYYCVGR
jgi:iron complex transport system ATP-binding protein